MKRGIMYLTIGAKVYIDYMLLSVRSLRKAGCKEPVIVVHDNAHPNVHKAKEYGCILKEVEPCGNEYYSSRFYKTQLLNYCDFDETMYIDADTFILKDIGKMWEFLNEAEILMALDEVNPTVGHLCGFYLHYKESNLNDSDMKNDARTTMEECSLDFPMYASGLMLWKRTPLIEHLFKEWHKEWLRFKTADQLSLARVIKKNNIPVKKLSKLYHYQCIKELEEAREEGAYIFSFQGPNRHKIVRYLEEDTPVKET